MTVTAYLDADDPTAYCIQNYGMVPSELTKIYTVSGLKSYVKSISEISDSSLKECSHRQKMFIIQTWQEVGRKMKL